MESNTLDNLTRVLLCMKGYIKSVGGYDNTVNGV